MRLGLLGTTLALFLATSGVLAQPVRGDPKAWDELLAAFANLATHNTYRMRTTVPGKPVVVMMDFVKPDRFRMVITPFLDLQGNMEAIFVDVLKRPQARFRINHPGLATHPLIGRWLCFQEFPIKPPQQLIDELEKGVEEVTVSRLGEVLIDGEATQGYQFTWVGRIEGQRRTVRGRWYVSVDRNLPRRVESLDEAGNVEGVTDYLDYGAPITIDLPACELTLPSLDSPPPSAPPSPPPPGSPDRP